MNDSISSKIPGLARPYAWIQPVTYEQLLERLAQAREYAVNERERENLCAVAHDELNTLLSERQWIATNVVYLEHLQNGLKPQEARIGGWWPVEEENASAHDPELVGLDLLEYIKVVSTREEKA